MYPVCISAVELLETKVVCTEYNIMTLRPLQQVGADCPHNLHFLSRGDGSLLPSLDRDCSVVADTLVIL